MAVIGTQTSKHEISDNLHVARGSLFNYIYPVNAVYPGGSGSVQAVVTEAPGTGGGISIYNRA